MSRFLTEIRTDAPVKESLDDLRVREPDLDALAAFCAKYEFAAIAKRFGMDAAKAGGDPRALSSRDIAAAPISRLADIPHAYTLVDSDGALASLAAELKAAPLFAFDTETDSANPSEAALVGISFATAPGKAWYVPFAAAASAAAPAAEPDDLFAMMAPPPQPSGDALCGIARTAIVAALAPVFASGAEKVAHNS